MTPDKQHMGGLSGLKGFRYQDFVVVLELIRGGVEVLEGKGRSNWTYHQEAADSFTDDLHISEIVEILEDDEVRVGARTHIQIKSQEGLTWLKALRKQFASEVFRYPNAMLKLCVHRKEIEESLNNRKKHHGLEKVAVYCIPYEQSLRPHVDPEIIHTLEKLQGVEYYPHIYFNMWSNLYCTWIFEFHRYASLDEFFCKAAERSNGAIKSLFSAAPEVDEIVNTWNAVQSELTHAADNSTLTISFDHRVNFSPLTIPIAAIPDDVWSNDPSTEPLSILNKLGILPMEQSE